MSFTAAIDISTFIWSEQDFNQNKNQYMELKALAPDVYSQIKSLKLPILFRDSLQQLIWAEFPYKVMAEKEIGYEFQRLTFEFFIDTFSNWAIYIDNGDKTIAATPTLCKPHFSNNIQAEVQSQVCHLFQYGQNPEHKFITYNYFFNQQDNLVLKRQQEILEVDTLSYHSKSDISSFFSRYRIRFKHHEKHRRNCYYDNIRHEVVSPFSSYHNQGEGEAQKLLEGAFLHEGHFYNFDLENNVYVRFIHTTGLTYHGHDISDEGNNVPNRVKKKFNKNGRTFQP